MSKENNCKIMRIKIVWTSESWIIYLNSLSVVIIKQKYVIHLCYARFHYMTTYQNIFISYKFNYEKWNESLGEYRMLQQYFIILDLDSWIKWFSQYRSLSICVRSFVNRMRPIKFWWSLVHNVFVFHVIRKKKQINNIVPYEVSWN